MPRRLYWALVRGVPKKHEDKISTWLVKEQTPDGDRVRIARHGEEGADHAVTHYRVVEQAGQTLSWLEMEPHTGRTHQLRVHAAHIGCPIIGDPKYFEADQNWDFPGGMQNRLHLHARRIIIPHPGRRRDRRHRAAAAAYAAELEPARLRRGERGGGSMSAAAGTFDRRDAVDAAAVALMIGLTFSWGLNGVAAKLANAGFNPIFLTLARSAIGGLLVFLWCRYRGIPLFRADGTLSAGIAGRPAVRAGVRVDFRRARIHDGGAQRADGQHDAVLGADRRAFPARRAHVVRQARRTGAGIRAASRWCFPTSSACQIPRRSSATYSASVAGLLWAATTLVIKTTSLAKASAEKLLLYQLSVSAVMALPLLLFAGPVFREVSPLPVAALASRRSSSSRSPMCCGSG